MHSLGSGLVRAWRTGIRAQGQKVRLRLRRVSIADTVTVYDGVRPTQFRATGGAYDWNAIAAHIIEIAERKIVPFGHARPRSSRTTTGGLR